MKLARSPNPPKKGQSKRGRGRRGCGGNSASPEPKRSPAALLVQSRVPQKSFLFLLEEKIGRAQNKKLRRKLFCGTASEASGGGAASSFGVLRKMGSDFFKQTPPNLICRLFCLGATRLGGHFVQEIPGGFETDGQLSRRKAAVRADGFEESFDFIKIFLMSEIFGLVGLNNPVSHEFEPMITFSLKIR